MVPHHRSPKSPGRNLHAAHGGVHLALQHAEGGADDVIFGQAVLPKGPEVLIKLPGAKRSGKDRGKGMEKSEKYIVPAEGQKNCC